MQKVSKNSLQDGDSHSSKENSEVARGRARTESATIVLVSNRSKKEQDHKIEETGDQGFWSNLDQSNLDQNRSR